MNEEPNNDDIDLTHVIEKVIENGANSAEEIHRAVADLPISVLENLGMQDTADSVKKIQDRSIGTIYKLIRTVNHEVAGLASELLEIRDRTRSDRTK